ncbi:MAG: TldD/PmbA family protein [Phycisphaerae bacterium]
MCERPGLSRRDFVRYAASGAAALLLAGCGATRKRGLSRSSLEQTGLADRAGFRRLADVALNASAADHLLVSLRETDEDAVVFSHNEIVQCVDVGDRGLAVSLLFGQQAGGAVTGDLSDEGVAAAVRQAERVAKESEPDPEHLPPLPPQRYLVLPTFRPETAAAGSARCAADAADVINLCRPEKLEATGSVCTSASAVGVAANSGLFAFERLTRAEFSLTACGANSAGWVGNANRSIDDLGVIERTRVAVEKATRADSPRALPAGRYTAILEPAAVAGLVAWLLRAMDARAYHSGTSALSGKLGQQVIDRRLTLRNRPDHPSLLGRSFDGEGLPSDARSRIEHGVLEELNYDRCTAKRHGASPSYRPDALHLAGDGPAGESVDDLVRATERGVLVTSFSGIRRVSAGGLTLAGLTQGGTFLVEDGKIAGGLVNACWEDSPLRVFNEVAAFTPPADAMTTEGEKMLVPAMVIRDFNFARLTQA